MDRIKKANYIQNPFEKCSEQLKEYNHRGTQIKIIFKRLKEISENFLNELLQLTEENVGNYYKSSNLGWSKEDKRKEFTSKNASYLIAENEGIMVGFSMFKFDMDYERAVLYCYELQIKDEYQGKGIGRHLLKCMEELANTFNMDFIVLTALNSNVRAMKFYEKCGFTLDETDPERNEYKILSKATIYKM